MVNNIVLVSQNTPEKEEKGGYLPSQQEVDRARNADGAVVSFLSDFAARDREAGRWNKLQRCKPGQEQDGAGAGIKEKI